MIRWCARLFEKSRRSGAKSVWECLLWKLCSKIKPISEWLDHFAHHPSGFFEIHTNHKSTSGCSQYVEITCYLIIFFTKRRWMRSILINTNGKNRLWALEWIWAPETVKWIYPSAMIWATSTQNRKQETLISPSATHPINMRNIRHRRAVIGSEPKSLFSARRKDQNSPKSSKSVKTCFLIDFVWLYHQTTPDFGSEAVMLENLLILKNPVQMVKLVCNLKNFKSSFLEPRKSWVLRFWHVLS